MAGLMTNRYKNMQIDFLKTGILVCQSLLSLINLVNIKSVTWLGVVKGMKWK